MGDHGWGSPADFDDIKPSGINTEVIAQADGDSTIIGEGTSTLDMLIYNYPWLRNCLLPEYRAGTMHPKLFILRGLPGAGKSTKVTEIQKSLTDDYRGYITCSADDYWMRPDGTYDWNPRKLKDAHAWCYKTAANMMEQPTEYQSHVILDNTNIKRKDFQAYVDLAKKHNYTIEEVVVGEFTEEACKLYAERNLHGCPLETILKKAKEFEP